jgi:uncharacterized protein
LNGAGSPFRLARGSVILAVRLTPKSSADKIESVGLFNGEPVLKARVRALPEAGRANDALERLIADWLGVPLSTVTVAQGGKSRLKRVAVAGDAAHLAFVIKTRLAALGPSS